MRITFLKRFSLAVLLLLGTAGLAETIYGQRLCPDPARPCGGFKPYELPFRIPSSRLARAEDRSAEFYAVVLKSADSCSIPESERVSAQALFPRNKVFLSRFECDPEDAINYTGVADKLGVLAVYGGSSRGEAQRFLGRVRRTGRFPDAYLKRMRVILVHP
jgi:hypothetical protein